MVTDALSLSVVLPVSVKNLWMETPLLIFGHVKKVIAVELGFVILPVKPVACTFSGSPPGDESAWKVCSQIFLVEEDCWALDSIEVRSVWGSGGCNLLLGMGAALAPALACFNFPSIGP